MLLSFRYTTPDPRLSESCAWNTWKFPGPVNSFNARWWTRAKQAGAPFVGWGRLRPSPKIGWWSPWQYWYQAGRLAMASGLSWRCILRCGVGRGWDVVWWWRGSLRMGRYYDLRDFLMGNTPCLNQSMLVSETRNGTCTPIYGNFNRKYDDGMWIWDILYHIFR